MSRFMSLLNQGVQGPPNFTTPVYDSSKIATQALKTKLMHVLQFENAFTTSEMTNSLNVAIEALEGERQKVHEEQMQASRYNRKS